MRAARPAGRRGPRAGTRVDSHPRPRRHGRPRPRSHLCPHSHPPLAPSACTHARGPSEWVHAAGGGGGGGASGGGRLSPRKPLVGREELRLTQPGTARCAAERSGGAAGGCSGLWAARAGQRQMGALITETARTDAPLTRTRHAWVVRRLERADGARSALPLYWHRSPALEVSAGGVGGLGDPDASCRLQTALLSPCTGRIPSLRRIRGH